LGGTLEGRRNSFHLQAGSPGLPGSTVLRRWHASSRAMDRRIWRARWPH